MSSNKKVGRVRAQKIDRTIQYASMSLIVIVTIVFVWNRFPKPAGVASPACGYFESIPASDQYDQAPPFLIDPSKQYIAQISLEKGGVIEFELYPDKAPIAVNNFIFLACKGFYNGVTFHRVIENFMAQTGDPTGRGTGGPGYRFENEESDLSFDREGVVAMANAGPDTNGSQFFITFGPAVFLDGGYTIFGQVTDGMEVVRSITLRDPQQNPTFEGNQIDAVLVSEN